MKRIMSLYIIVIFILVGCDDSKKPVEDNKLGLISTDVTTNADGLSEKPEYIDLAPGTSKPFDRAFENAPPMIPHKTEGFFPITTSNNICLTCHLPEKIAESKAIPIPETHFMSLRPDLIEDNGVISVNAKDNEVVKKDLGNKLNNAYFLCNTCHAPQAKVTVDISNLFTPEFREQLNKNKSTLKDKINEGI